MSAAQYLIRSSLPLGKNSIQRVVFAMNPPRKLSKRRGVRQLEQMVGKLTIEKRIDIWRNIIIMHECCFKLKTLPLLVVSVILSFSSLSFAEVNGNRPFWTEKSSFIEGNVLYAIGVSSNVKTVEIGRETAFAIGKTEIMNYAQIANLEDAGILIETQMTFEEKNKDGTYNIYRLIKTDLEKLLSVQKGLQNTSQKKMEEMNNIVEINKAMTESFINKRREIEGLTKKGNEVIAELEKLKKSVTEKGVELDALYSRLQKEVASRNIVISKIEEKKVMLDKQDKSIEQLHQQIVERILNKELKVKKYITEGMTKKDVKSLIGEPDGIDTFNDYWFYGRTKLSFVKNSVGIVYRIEQ